jgi:hypothetical protein
MPANVLNYRRRDLETALRVLKEAGLPIKGLEIDNHGKITVQVKTQEPEPCADDGENQWDEVLAPGYKPAP